MYPVPFYLYSIIKNSPNLHSCTLYSYFRATGGDLHVLFPIKYKFQVVYSLLKPDRFLKTYFLNNA